MEIQNQVANENQEVVPIEPPRRPFQLPGVVITQLCNFATFKELKSFRQVSRLWNCIISQYPRFSKNRYKFTKGWNLTAQTLDLSSTPKWKNVRICHYNVTNQPYFHIYWEQMKSTVEILKLENIKIRCNDFTNLINSIPRLKHLSLVDIKFETIVELKESRVQNTSLIGKLFQHLNEFFGYEDKITTVINCDHNQIPFIPTQPIGLRTITSLEIKKQQMPLPHCLLNILIQRCQLEEFKLNGFIISENMSYNNPKMEDTINGLVQILRNSQTTLKDFTYVNNSIGCGGLLIQMGNMEQFPNLRLVNLTYLEYKKTTNDDVRDGLQNILRNQGNQALNNGQVVQGQEVVIAASAAEAEVEATLRNVSLTMYLGPDNSPILNLEPFLHNLTSLRKLKIGLSFARNLQRPPLELVNFMQQIPQITEFEFSDIQYIKEYYKSDWIYRRRYGLAFIHNFQNTIRGISLSYAWPLEGIAVHDLFLRNADINLLTKFEMKNAKDFDDQLARTLIQNLRALEELTIENSQSLTDSGITGLDPATCRTLLNCSSHSLAVNGNLVNNYRPTLTGLINLKKLSLSGCKQISNISIRYGISLPKLKWLDLSQCTNVSDTGLVWLAQTNPALEVVRLRKMVRISHYGLNRLISLNKSILKIYVTETCVHRRFANPYPNYDEHPQFKQIVDYSRSREKEDPNESIKYMFFHG